MKKWMIMLVVLALLIPTLAHADGPRIRADEPWIRLDCPLPDLGVGGWDSWGGWREAAEELVLPYGLHIRVETLASDSYVLSFAAVACPTSEMPCEDGRDDIAVLAREFGGLWSVESWAVCPTTSEVAIVWASLTGLNDPDGASWEAFDAFANWEAGVLLQSQLKAIAAQAVDWVEHPYRFYIFPRRLIISVEMTAGVINEVTLAKPGGGSIVIGPVDGEWVLIESDDAPWLGAFSEATLCFMNCGSAGCFRRFAYDQALESTQLILKGILASQCGGPCYRGR